jgi:hypothetical protein
MFQKFVAKSLGLNGECSDGAAHCVSTGALSARALGHPPEHSPVAVVDQVARALADMASAALDAALDIAREHHNLERRGRSVGHYRYGKSWRCQN